MRQVKKLFTAIACIAIASTGLAAFSTVTNAQTKIVQTQSVNQATYKKPKYIFTFIGDGMSYVQLNAAQVYQSAMKSSNIELSKLAITQFPVVGSATTQDSTSFCPDSASTATAISSGIKTHSGVIGLGIDKKTAPESITEKLKEEGYKIGIVSSVSIDHATPAAFYAHVASRKSMYDIALQLAESDFDYFAGGGLVQPTGANGDQKDAYEIIKEKGYNIVNTKEDILSLNNNSGKTYAISPELQDSKAMYYDLDAQNTSIRLKDFVQKGIDVLDNEDGFFMMVEGGKIDWAGHANDAMANIQDTIALDEAVKVAMEFAKKHPEETLIVVTGDHETGGMSIGQATTGYDTAFNLLSHQKMTYVEFDNLIKDYKKEVAVGNKKGTIEEVFPLIQENFGLISPNDAEVAKNSALVLTDYEYNKLVSAFEETMKAKEIRSTGVEVEILYGGYEPLSITLTHILNNKAGIGWTSYAHTGVPVPVYTMGTGAEIFNGSYDNTDIFNKMVELCKLN
ncbi:alkaline phosphatase [Sporanaerobium hydrogeniformans]|uniref:Alkaline phosphatase n=1 Tax=Sporanaerobium hydrogeniformans TaxID=3072179 RepID=A0AC61DCX2_9FIRM|nr:alkaline phosphatase [Sporanaerobium hydrogeniformans]PHV70812.1 alkaline phosphatase [Sporanaerobium hydrogeniformans]